MSAQPDNQQDLVIITYIFMGAYLGVLFFIFIYLKAIQRHQVKNSQFLLNQKLPILPLKKFHLKNSWKLRKMQQEIDQEITKYMILQEDVQQYHSQIHAAPNQPVHPCQEAPFDSKDFVCLGQNKSISFEVSNIHQKYFKQYKNYKDLNKLFASIQNEYQDDVKQYKQIYNEVIYGEQDIVNKFTQISQISSLAIKLEEALQSKANTLSGGKIKSENKEKNQAEQKASASEQKSSSIYTKSESLEQENILVSNVSKDKK